MKNINDTGIYISPRTLENRELFLRVEVIKKRMKKWEEE